MVQYYLSGDFGREHGVYSNNEVRRTGIRAI